MLRTQQLVWSVTIAATMLAAEVVKAQGTGQRAEGRALAQQVCAVCHAIDKRELPSPNAAAPRFETIAHVPGMTALALSVALRTSHSTMPNLILDDDEVKNVAAYILSLK